MRVYTPLELAGRNIYVREGCYACHSQMIRTLRDEVERYGPYSLAVESKYDHPMLWGSKRTGPDLARIGGKYSDEWHVAHLINPRDVVPPSVMPSYAWLLRNAAAHRRSRRPSQGHARGRRALHRRDDRQRARRRLRPGRARQPARRGRDQALRRGDRRCAPSTAMPGELTEMDALVAYLQILGRLTDAAHKTASRRRRVTMASRTTTLVWFAKSVGLFYLIGLSIIVLAYAYWPSNKKRFDQAAAVDPRTTRTGHGQ